MTGTQTLVYDFHKAQNILLIFLHLFEGGDAKNELKIMSKNTPSSISEKTVMDKFKVISKNETRDWDHIRRNKWWLLLASILLVIFIIWRCPILSFFYRLTGINLVRDCPSKGKAFSLSDLVQNLSTSGAPNSIVVSSPDGTLYSVSTDINGTTVINTLPLPTLNGTSGTNGIDGIDGLNGLPGPAGPIGLTGATGSNGTNGSNGSNGTNGTNGSAGAVGPAGPAGPPGLPAPVPGAPCVGGEYLVWDGVAFVCTLTTNTLVNDGINTMTSTVNGVADSDPIISTNTNSLTQAGGLVNTVNGVVATTAIASAAPTNLLGFDGLGNPVYDFVGDVLADNTTNLLTWTQAGGLSSDVNGAVSTVAIAGGTIVNDIGYDVGGVPVRMPRYNWQVGANFGPNYTITDGITWKATSGNNSIQTTNSGGNTTEFDVVVSPNAGNSLSALISGLYVPTFLSNAVTSINTTATGPNVDIVGTPGETNISTVGNTITVSLDPNIVCPGSLTTFCQNGNSFGTAGVLGTNDAFDLTFETSGLQRGLISDDGLAIHFGAGAGTGASQTYTNFIGSNAGLGASGADNSNFIGLNAGNAATSAMGSNFIGTDAGNTATGAFMSNFIGMSAGNGATDASLANFIGFNAGAGATNAEFANIIGFGAGGAATFAQHAVFIGTAAGASATNAANAVFIGGSAGDGAVNTNSSVFIGNSTGFNATNAQNSIFIGTNTGMSDTVNNTMGGSSILIGNSANTGGFSNSIGLGAGATNTATNQFVLGGGTNPVDSIYETYIGRNDANAFPLIYANTTGVGLGMTTPTAQLNVAGSGFGMGGTAGIQWEGVMMNPALSSLNAGRIYYNSTTQGFECSLNTGVYTPCISGTLNAADNGLSLSGTTVQLGQNVGAMGNPGQLLSNREIPYSGFNIVYDPLASVGVTSFGGPAIATKEVSVYGDLLVTGVIDPTALLFSPQTPTSYDPTNPMNNGYRIGVSATVPSTGMPGTQLPIYVSPLSDNTRVFEVRDAANINTVFDVDTFNRRAGVRTNNPNSTLHIDGSLAVSYDQVTFPIMLDETYQTLVVGPGGSVLLPDATGIVGRIYTLKNESGMSITPSTMFGQTIDGIAPTAIEDLNAKWYISDGSNWHSIASFGGGTVTAGAGLTNSGTLSAPILDVLADNGLQVDAAADRVRLGGSVGSLEASNASLLFNTEVPLAGFNLNWTGSGNMGVMASGTNAQERLHVQPSTPMNSANVLFEGMIGSGSTPAFTAYDTTMYWSPGRSAFRAGTATGMQWDNGNVGDYSTAFGLNTTASGMESMAWGENSNATATHATAWGMNTTASGSESTSWGMMSNASGPFATSFGVMTTAMMNGATAWGESSDALGNYSTAWGGMNMMGMGPQATGDYATAFGINTTAGGAGTTAATSWGDTTQALASRSTAWGQNTLVTAMATNGTAFGFDTEASSMQATAFGTSTTASGPNATAWGNTSTAWNMQSTAFGNMTNASGQNSTSFGDTTIASGENSTTFGDTSQALSSQGTAWGQNTLVAMMATNGTAFGFDTEANGLQSTAFGSSTTANGQDATSFGNMTTANGIQSTAFGSSTMAMGNYSTAYGLSNFAVGEGTTAWGTTNMAQGDYSTVWGTSTQTAMGATNSTAFGLDTEANALQATSFGFGTTASGVNSTSFGDYTDATGISATAWGGGNGGPTGPQATGDYSTAFGITTTASDLGTTAWGLSTFATNDYATSFGMGTQATGQSSTAFGMGSQATNTQATAWGQMTTATAINSTAWGMDSDAIADQATAWGNMTSASGLNSTTWGDTTIASNDEATAWGNSTIASATSATSFGTGTVANALNATSFGQGSNVGMMGINGTAFGNMTIANQVNATAFGDTTTANGLNSTSFGNLTMASGDNSTAWGVSTNASTNQSTAWGNTTNATATNATSFGVGTNATANQSTAFGALTTAAGLNGTAWGQNTTVAMTASNGTAFGDDTDAVGINSTAWGNLTAANGLDATAFGISTIANGDYATAYGNTTQALDTGTAAWGNGSIAGDSMGGGVYSTAFGMTTLADGISSTAWGLGNGTSGARGDYSTSFGEYTYATGIASTAWGGVNGGMGNTTASGDYSTAFGITTEANALGTTAWGSNSTAGNGMGGGQYATAYGVDTTASGDMSTAWGNNTQALDQLSTSWGLNTIAGDGIGNGLYATAFGDNTLATGQSATAWGGNNGGMGNTIASEDYATAFGITTLADGLSSTAWGSGDGSTGAHGDYATAFGINTTAQSLGSTSWGINSTAGDGMGLGWYATAWGNATNATGQLSTAFGDTSTASADNATAWGMLATASGSAATAWGSSTTASSINGTAWGTGTSASAGSNTTAFGETTIASGNNATAWGLSTTAGGELTTSFGAGTSAGGYAATAWGGNDGSIPAWMIPTTANGAFSTAFGFGTSANGFGSTTFGYANTAIYDGTTAWGAGNYSIGNGSTVWGQGNITGVNSDPSTTTYVNDTFMQTILGSYAIRNGNNGDPGFGGPTLAEAVTDEEQLFIIGNGNGIPLDPEERSTAFFVNWTGDMFFERELRTGQDLGTYPDGYAGLAGDVLLSTGSGTASAWTDDDITFWKTGGNTGLTEGTNNRIGTTNEATGINLIFMTDGVDRGIIDATGNFGIGTLAPVNLLDVEGAVAIGAGYSGTSTAPANGLIVEGNTAIGATSATNRLQVTDAGDDTVASFTGLTQTCTVDTSGGGGWSCSSDQNLKTNISNLTSGLDTLSLLRPVSYNWISNPNDGFVNGFIAQEVEQVLPGLVGNDDRGFKTLNMGGLMPIVVKSIQEQQTQITTLSLDMEGLKQEVGNVTSPTPTPEEQSGLLAMITNAINEFFNSVSVAFNKTATFLSGAVFKGRVEFEDTDAGGYATITSGASEVRVDFDKAFTQVPLITANTDDPDVRIGLKDKSEAGFTIYMKSPASSDVEITWTALAVKNARRVAGTSTTQPTVNSNDKTQPTSAPTTDESTTSATTSSPDESTILSDPTPTTQPETPTNVPVSEMTSEPTPSETVASPSPEME